MRNGTWHRKRQKKSHFDLKRSELAFFAEKAKQKQEQREASESIPSVSFSLHRHKGGRGCRKQGKNACGQEGIGGGTERMPWTCLASSAQN